MIEQTRVLVFTGLLAVSLIENSHAFSTPALLRAPTVRTNDASAVLMSAQPISRRNVLRDGIAGAAILGNVLPALAEETLAAPVPVAEPEMKTTESGVRYQVTRTTTAPGDKSEREWKIADQVRARLRAIVNLVFNIVETAKKGDLVITSILAKTKSGKVIMDTSASRQGFAITLGQGKVIQGLEDGIVGMKAGEERRLFIPAGPLSAPLQEDLDVTVTYERKSNLMKMFGFGG